MDRFKFQKVSLIIVSYLNFKHSTIHGFSQCVYKKVRFKFQYFDSLIEDLEEKQGTLQKTNMDTQNSHV